MIVEEEKGGLKSNKIRDNNNNETPENKERAWQIQWLGSDLHVNNNYR